ncbi:hypothetical protein GQ457_07G004870 [Hibiscus cannabinus]
MGEAEGSFGLNAKDLSLVPNLEIPPKFKMPEFEKFDGNTCLTTHITLFCRKMTGFIENEGLLIHCFQDSLVGPASRWYSQLTRDYIKSWKDLARAFTDQYKHVYDMIPNRLMLQGLEQKPNESLRQHAQRWRDVLAQVQPPIQENKITDMFIDTLKGVLYDRLIGHPAVSFADIVMTGERIEDTIRKGNISFGPSASHSDTMIKSFGPSAFLRAIGESFRHDDKVLRAIGDSFRHDVKVIRAIDESFRHDEKVLQAIGESFRHDDKKLQLAKEKWRVPKEHVLPKLHIEKWGKN